MTHLHVFALNTDLDLRHTHLTRARGEVADLPPLADWLGVTVDPDEVELFPVRDLDNMTLSDYVTAAFAPESEIARGDRARIDALAGSVLLVPDRALGDAAGGAPKPGAALTLVASLPLAQADHVATLPRVDVDPLPMIDTEVPADIEEKSGSFLVPLVILAVIVVLIGWLLF